MQSQCSCPKWYDVLDLDAVFAPTDNYETNPVVGKDVQIYLPCSVRQNENELPMNHFAIGEFNGGLFAEWPYPETLHLHLGA